MKRDGREIARMTDLRLCKALHKYSFLRTRDLAVLLFQKARSLKGAEFQPVPMIVDGTAWRMTQRSLARLRRDRLVVWGDAPDGSLIYALSEAGARMLEGLGIPAKSGKESIWRVSLSHFHHRRLANEMAIVASVMGYRVKTEHEIATGRWIGGTEGVKGKEPDFLVLDGREVHFGEVERSRRRKSDSEKLFSFLLEVFGTSSAPTGPVPLDGGYSLKKVVFVCGSAFMKKLSSSLKEVGWTDEMIASRLSFVQCIYPTEAKFIRKKAQIGVRAAESISAS